MRIEPGEAGYDALYSRWQSEGGTTVVLNGEEWLVIRDNDKMVFCRIGSASGIDGRYSGSSIPTK